MDFTTCTVYDRQKAAYLTPAQVLCLLAFLKKPQDPINFITLAAGAPAPGQAGVPARNRYQEQSEAGMAVTAWPDQ